MDNNSTLICGFFAMIMLLVVVAIAGPVPMEDRIAAIAPASRVEWPSRIISISQAKASWRLCYTSQVFHVLMFVTTGTTYCAYGIMETPTLVEATNQIDVLNLNLTSNQIVDVSNLTAIPVE